MTQRRTTAQLAEYRSKRDFERTPEPPPEAVSHAENRYVVQKHGARRLHYDFRLQMEGVLRSWALPKGPSRVAGEKRLAVQTEDHPLAYGDFEGIIPRGEYGGGTVMLWDRGVWQPLGDAAADYRRGRLSFRLDGEKLHGVFHLVRMGGRAGDGGKNWLLIKRGDEHARARDDSDAGARSVTSGRTLEQIASQADRVWHSGREQSGDGAFAAAARRREPRGLEPGALAGARKARLPAEPRPELATLVKEPPRGADWIHEIKLDGYRILCRIEKGVVRLLTRQGQDWTERFASVAAAARTLPGRALLDGELVALRADGHSDFQALQNALKGEERAELVFYAFDLPWCDGFDLCAVPLLERKHLLRRLLAGAPSALRYCDHVHGSGPEAFAEACELGLEGLVSKRRDAPYEPGRRTRNWLKSKCAERQEFVVVGYTPPRGSRAGFGALELALRLDDGWLRSAGRVGTGFNQRTLRELSARLRELERATPPLADPPRAAGVRWVEPELVVEVSFSDWTRDGKLRHPVFRGLREDKPAREVHRERPTRAGSASRAARAPSKPSQARARKAAPRKAALAQSSRRPGQPIRGGVEQLRLTHPERVLYPDLGLTKRDLAEFYGAIAECVLPHVAGRPLSLVRCPDGLAGACFYQKHPGAGLPDAIATVKIAEKSGERRYAVVNDVAGLLGLVQLDVLEIHPWGSRVDDLEHPDRLIFDLDPGPGLHWSDVVHAAHGLRTLLEAAQLQSFVRTSGGKGLHLVVPLAGRPDWALVRDVAREFAAALARQAPDRYVITATKARRQRRIFLDHLRNARGATAVASYSTRARPGAPVATPLRWSELGRVRDAAQYGVPNLLRRLARQREDPWEGFFELEQRLDPALLDALRESQPRAR